MFVKTANNNKSKSNNNVNAKNTNAFIQPKLNVGKPGDKYEVEADKMADQVVAKSKEPSTAFIAPTPNIQKQAEEEVQQQNEPTIQEKSLAESITPVVQLKPIDTIQKQPEEEVQAKEEEDVQLKEEELQTKKEIQLSEEEEVQTKEDEEVQSKEEDEVQAKKEDEIQPKQEEDLQQKSENEPIQLKENETRVLEPNKPLIQKQSEEDVQTKEDEEIQEKEEEEVQTLQMQSSADAGTTSSVENNLNKGGGSPLASNTKSEMESGFGADFGGVRVHNDSNAVQMNKELGSQAFTNGNDVYFNEGKYNPSSDSGKHLLAHELTHTVQQGASNSKNIQKEETPVADTNTEPVAASIPSSAIDISQRFELNDAWSTYIDSKYEEGDRNFDVNVKIGEQYRGTIKVTRMRNTAEGESPKYELASGNQRYLTISGWSFLDPLRQAGVAPILVLRNFGDEQQTNGFLSVKIGDNALTADVQGFIRGINENLEQMQFLGIEPINVDGLENTFEDGRLVFQVTNLTTNIDGYLEAGGTMGITGSTFTFNLNANVDIAGLASGDFNVTRGEDGKLSGTGEIQAEIANVQAIINVEYDDGAVTIQGTGRMESEKFSGEITLLVTDAVKSTQMMNAALGVETMESEVAEGSPATPKTKNNQVLAGWGEIHASITPWLEGTAKVGIDNEGHVTIVGEIIVPDEIELMEQRGKKTDLFNVEIRAGYGIPLVGQVFLFASIGMFINAGFGPLVLKDIGFTGTYSTDPNVLQQFSVTGTLGINAFAIIGLEAEAGVGLTLLGHDIKAGVNVTAAAGLQAYAEATPTLEYQEQATPEGGKTGETRLKGHFEAAAQLFLQLSGALFYELDSPWWSPAPDGREESPLGEVQYPIGDSMGIGADMDWLVGSDEAPELTFSPVEFDADKFTADVMADPPPRTRGDADASPEGEWTGEPGSGQAEPSITGDAEGLPESDRRRQEDLANLPDEQKYMRALDEMSTLESANPKPTYDVVNAKATRVKRKYGLERIELRNREDESVEIFVKHRNQDNTRHLVHITLMSPAERARMLVEAVTDLRARETSASGEEGKLTRDQARELLTAWKTANPIIEDADVVDGSQTWDYNIDIGDRNEVERGKLKAENDVDSNLEPILETISENFVDDDGETHELYFNINSNRVSLYMASNNPEALEDKINKQLAEPTTNEEQKEMLNNALTLKMALDQYVNTHLETQDVVETESIKAEIENRLNNIRRILLDSGIDHIIEVPLSNVTWTMNGNRANTINADPLTNLSGNTRGQSAGNGSRSILEGSSIIDSWVAKEGTTNSISSLQGVHVLADYLHGPWTTWNIVFGTRTLNNNMRTPEGIADEKIKNNEIISFSATVNFYSNNMPQFINENSSVEEIKEVLRFYIAESIQVQIIDKNSQDSLFNETITGTFPDVVGEPSINLSDKIINKLKDNIISPTVTMTNDSGSIFKKTTITSISLLARLLSVRSSDVGNEINNLKENRKINKTGNNFYILENI